MNPSDVVITGIPRGGTTLTCELLNRVENTVALDEPMDGAAWSDRTILARLSRRRGRPRPLNPRPFIREVRAFFEGTRRSLLAGEPVLSKHVGGKAFGGKFLDERTETGFRKRVTSRGAITVEKPLAPDFILAVKHNAGFTVALEHLVKAFRTYAIIRHPLAILSSWQTVDMPVNRGRVRSAERSDPQLRALLDSTPDVLDRQLLLLNWFFERYDRHLPRESVISYESIVSSGGAALSVISPGAAALGEGLQSRNRASVYDPEMMRKLGERLLTTDGAWWNFYAPDSVRELME